MLKHRQDSCSYLISKFSVFCHKKKNEMRFSKLSNEYLIDIIFFCTCAYRIKTLCLVNYQFFQLVSPFLYEYTPRSIYQLSIIFDKASICLLCNQSGPGLLPISGPFLDRNSDLRFPIFWIENKKNWNGIFGVATKRSAQIAELVSRYVERKFGGRVTECRIWNVECGGASGVWM